MLLVRDIKVDLDVVILIDVEKTNCVCLLSERVRVSLNHGYQRHLSTRGFVPKDQSLALIYTSIACSLPLYRLYHLFISQYLLIYSLILSSIVFPLPLSSDLFLFPLSSSSVLFLWSRPLFSVVGSFLVAYDVTLRQLVSVAL